MVKPPRKKTNTKNQAQRYGYSRAFVNRVQDAGGEFGPGGRIGAAGEVNPGGLAELMRLAQRGYKKFGATNEFFDPTQMAYAPMLGGLVDLQTGKGPRGSVVGENRLERLRDRYDWAPPGKTPPWGGGPPPGGLPPIGWEGPGGVQQFLPPGLLDNRFNPPPPFGREGPGGVQQFLPPGIFWNRFGGAPPIGREGPGGVQQFLPPGVLGGRFGRLPRRRLMSR